MFETAPLNPPDAIFGLLEDFKRDPHPEKINLSVGVYQDESGVTPVMRAVHEAERRLLEARGGKSYLPIDGSPDYREAIGRLILGDARFDQEGTHVATAQTPGGTVSLRVAGELIRTVFGGSKIWMSRPTWANHRKIFEAAGLEIGEYEYLDADGTRLDFDRVLASLDATKPGEAILLHTVCHNPTGVDPTPAQWEQWLAKIRERQLIPVFDFAYQGFGESLDGDAFPIRHLVDQQGEALICNSFSKNFGLYGERVGGITAVSQQPETSRAMLSQIKRTIRAMYSNPPLHGGSIVRTILTNADLKNQWEQELTEIRERIARLRRDFVEAMSQRLPQHDFDYIIQQRGMFSYSGLTPEHVDRLREQDSIYALRSGRINIAGINANNLDRLCDAIARVVGESQTAGIA